jgi:hypothetical protein
MHDTQILTVFIDKIFQAVLNGAALAPNMA